MAPWGVKNFKVHLKRLHLTFDMNQPRGIRHRIYLADLAGIWPEYGPTWPPGVQKLQNSFETTKLTNQYEPTARNKRQHEFGLFGPKFGPILARTCTQGAQKKLKLFQNKFKHNSVRTIREENQFDARLSRNRWKLGQIFKFGLKKAHFRAPHGSKTPKNGF